MVFPAAQQNSTKQLKTQKQRTKRGVSGMHTAFARVQKSPDKPDLERSKNNSRAKSPKRLIVRLNAKLAQKLHNHESPLAKHFRAMLYHKVTSGAEATATVNRIKPMEMHG